MKRLIKSIRKNPNAGRTELYLPGMLTRTVTTVNGKITNVVEERPVQIIRSLFPEPDYLVTFESLTVQCCFCESEFDSEKLEVNYEDGEYVLDNICPICNKPDCLSKPIIDETVEEFKERKEVSC